MCTHRSFALVHGQVIRARTTFMHALHGFMVVQPIPSNPCSPTKKQNPASNRHPSNRPLSFAILSFTYKKRTASLLFFFYA
ncbi:MAG: hypothetical protein ACQEWW_25640, partial [Bacillota bacterium]